MYKERIELTLKVLGRPEVDPGHIEAWMRMDHGTLDGLSPRDFRQAVKVGVEAVDQCGEKLSQEVASTYGLS